MSTIVRNLFRRNTIRRGWIQKNNLESKSNLTVKELQVEPVIVVHGTFSGKANTQKELGAEAKQVRWWQKGSSFCTSIDDKFKTLGSNARCWSNLINKQEEFSWDGKNEEVSRQIAARSLANYLCELEQDDKILRYHIIAHSHGGNIAINAIKDKGDELKKIGRVVFLGTPFIELFSSLHRLKYLIFHRAALFFLGIGSFNFSVGVLMLSDLISEPFDNITTGLLYTIVWFLIALLSLPFAAKKQLSNNHLNFKNFFSISFPSDEAILITKYAADIKNDPEKLSTILPKVEWRSFLSSTIPGFRNLILEIPLYFILYSSFIANILTLGFLPILGDSMLYWYGVLLRNTLGIDVNESRFFWGRYRKGCWEHYLLGFLAVLHAVLFLFVGIIYLSIFLVVLIVIDFVIFGSIIYVGAILSRFFAKRGIKSLCKTALGDNLLFDAVSNISYTPSGVVCKQIPIDKGVIEECKLHSGKYASMALYNFYDVYNSDLTQAQQFTLLENLQNAFHAPEFLHNKYHSTDTIISQVAEVIANHTKQN